PIASRLLQCPAANPLGWVAAAAQGPGSTPRRRLLSFLDLYRENKGATAQPSPDRRARKVGRFVGPPGVLTRRYNRFRLRLPNGPKIGIRARFQGELCHRPEQR